MKFSLAVLFVAVVMPALSLSPRVVSSASQASGPQIEIHVSTVGAGGDSVPVPNANVTVLGVATAPTDAAGRTVVSVPAVSSLPSAPTRVDVVISAPDYGEFRYLSVPVYPDNGPILTPILKHAAQFDNLARVGAPSGGTPQVEAPDTPAPATVGCSGWSSTNTPPNRIRVLDDDPYHSYDNQVHTIDFQNCVDHVLDNEWIPTENYYGFATESLRSGAIAVKMYGWYQTIHPSPSKVKNGQCYDVDGSTGDQVWDPFVSYPSTNKAVADTWDYYLVDASGGPYFTSYRSGCGPTNPSCSSPTDACGQLNDAPAPGYRASQWGTESCALDGRLWYDILLNKYYFSPQSYLVHGPVQTASASENLPYFVPVTQPFSDSQVYLYWTATSGVTYYICYGAYLDSFASCFNVGTGVSNTFQSIPTGDMASVYYRLEACANGYCSAIMAGGVENRTLAGNDFYGTASLVWPYAAAYVGERNYSTINAPVAMYNGVPGFGGVVRAQCSSVAPGSNCGPYTWAVDNVYVNPYLSFYATVTQTEGGIADNAPLRLTPRWCNDTTCHSGE